MSKLSPIESEFETTEAAEAYDAWFRAKVQAALASTKPRIPHDEVVSKIQALIDSKERDAS